MSDPEDSASKQLDPDPTEAGRPLPSRRRTLGLVLAGLGFVILALLGWTAFRAYQAYHQLKLAAADVDQIQSATADLTHINIAAIKSTVEDLQQHSSKAKTAVNDPIYRLATTTPWLGANLTAVREVAITVEDLSRSVAPSLLQVAQTIRPSAIVTKNGAIDVTPFAQARQALTVAASTIDQERSRLGSIDNAHLIRPVEDAVVMLGQKLDDLSPKVHQAAVYARLAAGMLGADGARTYLVVFQNLAEPRATGGIFGSSAVLDVKDGHLHIAGQGASSRTIGPFQPPLGGLDPNQVALYTDRIGTYSTDVNFTPDFPSAAALFARMYLIQTGKSVDGVIAVDPVVLSYLLAGQPALSIGNGLSIDSDDIMDVLLAQVYVKYPTDAQDQARDAFLSAATSKAFSVVTSGSVSGSTTLDAFRRAAGERRLLVWSDHSSEQDDLLTTDMAGSLRPTQATPPRVGVYLNDGTGAKLGYYLGGEISTVNSTCISGRPSQNLIVHLSYMPPPGELPEYVRGYLGNAVQPLTTNVLLVAPTGGTIGDVRVSGKQTATLTGSDTGREVIELTVPLDAGKSADITASVTFSGGQLGLAPDGQVDRTPLAKPLSVTGAVPIRSC